MRILADVNVSKATVEALRSAGHDVLWALERLAAESDFAILSVAQHEVRTVLTNDKDFGHLAVHAGLPAECGVILLRLKGLSPDEVVTRTLGVIGSRTDWAGNFAVVDRRRVRLRPLPPATTP
jgi:predicted nuclease of predicted toxin-antitoxin system